jgi:hypothetical protein
MTRRELIAILGDPQRAARSKVQKQALRYLLTEKTNP